MPANVLASKYTTTQHPAVVLAAACWCLHLPHHACSRQCATCLHLAHQVLQTHSHADWAMHEQGIYKYRDAENMMPLRNVSLLSSNRSANFSSPITRAARASCCISSSSRRATRMMLPSKMSVLAATCTQATPRHTTARKPTYVGPTQMNAR